MDCLFCKIIAGEIPSRTIYEDDIVKVIMDVNPDAKGHLLVLPKDHYTDINDIPDEVLLHIRKVAIDMMNLTYEKLGASGVSMIQNNGDTQIIKHYHLHIKPHYPTDAPLKHLHHTTDEELDEVYNLLTK